MDATRFRHQTARLTYRHFFALFAVLSFHAALSAEAPPGEAPQTGTIKVTFTHIEGDRGGDIIASLYQGEDTWLKPDQALAVINGPVNGESLELKFEDVELGHGYAIQVFHDANRNGKLDFRRVIPIPTEGVGVSNNHERMGPPKYDKAEFIPDETPVELAIILRYL